jgi:hypothetical protein
MMAARMVAWKAVKLAAVMVVRKESSKAASKAVPTAGYLDVMKADSMVDTMVDERVDQTVVKLVGWLAAMLVDYSVDTKAV